MKKLFFGFVLALAMLVSGCEAPPVPATNVQKVVYHDKYNYTVFVVNGKSISANKLYGTVKVIADVAEGNPIYYLRSLNGEYEIHVHDVEDIVSSNTKR